MKVNRTKDFIERVAWAAILAGAGAALATGFDDWRLTLKVAAIAALAGACKVLTAQQTGEHGDGAAIPGGVIEGGAGVK